MSSIPGKAPSVKLPPSVESGRELLLEQLGRLLTIEETLAKLVLPELLLEMQDDGLTEAVQHHLTETRGHAGRIKEAFLALGEAPAGKPAYGLDGLRTEHSSTVPHVVPGARAAVHCAAAMGAEHYEIKNTRRRSGWQTPSARPTWHASFARTSSRRSPRCRSSAGKPTAWRSWPSSNGR